MALFVFGAGATRGASFVDPTKYPCLPPLDTDFFTQLQRVIHKKHRDSINDVLRDVVKLFGANFQVTLETAFTTLENTIRMLEVTGDNRDFKKFELQLMRDRLRQAIALVFEEAMIKKNSAGEPTLDAFECEYHKKFVREILHKKDNIISFNYDCLLDYSLQTSGDGKWHPRYGYGFFLGSKGRKLSGDEHWRPAVVAAENSTAHLYKLHGSLHFQFASEGDENTSVKLKMRPYTKQHGNLRFSIIPPEWHKAYNKGAYSKLWRSAADALHRAKHIVLIGYSLPHTDLHATALFRTSIKSGVLRSLVVVNPDQEARRRTRTVLQRGLSPDTRILSVRNLQEFVALDRNVWAV